jgi:hypothetical protein
LDRPQPRKVSFGRVEKPRTLVDTRGRCGPRPAVYRNLAPRQEF